MLFFKDYLIKDCDNEISRFNFNVFHFIENATSVMEQVAESDLTVTRKTEIASDLQIENYPYSLGDLTEVQLFREHMIIKELLKPLEDEVSEEEAL